MGWNFALDRAVEWSERLRRPLVIFEALRWDFPWHSKRMRRFVSDGMMANAQSVRRTNAFYYPYLEQAAGEGKGLLAALASRACVVVTDEFPCSFLPRMVAAAGSKSPVLMEQVDSNGLLPLRAAPKEFPTAFSFRRFLQKQLPEHLLNAPSADPIAKLKVPRLKALPAAILRRWPMAPLDASRTAGLKRFGPARRKRCGKKTADWVSSREARFVSGAAQRTLRRRHERPLSIPPFWTYLRARNLRRSCQERAMGA